MSLAGMGRWAPLRHVGPIIGIGLAAAFGTYAAVAAGFSETTGWSRLGWSLLASAVAGGLALLQAHGEDRKAKPRDHPNSRGGLRPHAEQLGLLAAGPANSLHQLPPDIEDFTAREEVLAEVASLLGRRDASQTAVAISAIAGKGGVGKTALAIHAAHQLRSRFPDGQLYVNLRGLDIRPLDPGDVLAGFLREFGLDDKTIPDTLDERARRYRAYLNDRRILVVLDNAASQAQIRPLLPGSASCAVLITSRARLAGLEGIRQLDLDVMPSEAAVELLGKITGAVRVAAEPETAREIARLCGNLPLAVRIAGAKLAARPQWTLSKLADRLSVEGERLAALEVGDLEVRASIALSYEGLGRREQHAFRLLSLLETSDFVAVMAGALLDMETRQAEDLIDRLVDGQLVEIGGEDQLGQIRYHFHDLLKEFAREQLEAAETSTERHAALGRVVARYLIFANVANKRIELGSPEEPDLGDMRPLTDTPELLRDPLRWLTVERSNLVALVKQAHSQKMWSSTWELARALGSFLEVRSLTSDSLVVHELGLDAARASQDQWGEAFMLRGLAPMYGQQGRIADEMACLERALELFKKLGDRHEQVITLGSISDNHGLQGRWAEAKMNFDQALADARKLGDRAAEAFLLDRMGWAYRFRGRYDEAIAYSERSLKISRELGSRLKVAWTLDNLLLAYKFKGRFNDAIRCYHQAEPLFLELGDKKTWAGLLSDVGDVYRLQGDYQKALACFRDCFKILDELGHHGHVKGYAWNNLGCVYLELKQYDDAALCFGKAMPLFEELGDEYGQAFVHGNRGRLLFSQSRNDQAIACFERSLPVFRDRGARIWEARTLDWLGRTLAANGQASQAGVAWQRALEIFQDLGVPEVLDIAARLEG